MGREELQPVKGPGQSLVTSSATIVNVWAATAGEFDAGRRCRLVHRKTPVGWRRRWLGALGEIVGVGKGDTTHFGVTGTGDGDPR